MVTPAAGLIEYPALLPDLGLKPARLLSYPKETAVAEKVQTIVKLAMVNSRMKDYYDLEEMARSFAFQGALLAEALRATFASRQTALPAEVPGGLTDAFAEDATKRAQWEGFLKTSRTRRVVNWGKSCARSGRSYGRLSKAHLCLRTSREHGSLEGLGPRRPAHPAPRLSPRRWRHTPSKQHQNLFVLTVVRYHHSQNGLWLSAPHRHTKGAWSHESRRHFPGLSDRLLGPGRGRQEPVRAVPASATSPARAWSSRPTSTAPTPFRPRLTRTLSGPSSRCSRRPGRATSLSPSGAAWATRATVLEKLGIFALAGELGFKVVVLTRSPRSGGPTSSGAAPIGCGASTWRRWCSRRTSSSRPAASRRTGSGGISPCR